MWVGFFGNTGNAHEAAAATAAATCASTGRCGIQDIEEVTVFIFEGGKQGFQIIVQSAGVRGDNGIDIQFRGDGHFLATLDHIGAGTIGKIQLYTTIGGGDEGFTFLDDVANTQFTQVAVFVTRPCLT
ncbi:hypothetical protein [Halomonas sp. C22]|uniref:hypothetical protein n=1 Tax=Halomonas sp. C22 TaxID=2580567 RepID=UPI0011A77ED2|nr:hypothetical protein [Halomonas sp. C22]